MYCLVVTDDYSRFTWVFFLATTDEASGILKSFITRIDNLVDHKVKVIRCDNETKFKNREMDQFCEMKGKFDSKVDEGFFVGYSWNSKAFRVFNSRTRIVEENLHIRFSENTSNDVGTKASDNACQARKETKHVKNYILLPLWTADPPFSQDSKSSHNDGSKPSCDDGKKVDEDPRNESESKDQEKEDNVNNSTINAASTNEEKELLFDPNMLALEDLHARVDGKKIIITEASIRRDLQLADEEGVDCLPNSTIFKQLALMGFDSVSKHFNDSLLARGNTLRSDEDKMKLNELIALCTTLQNMVLELEKIKTSQNNEIASLKRMVKKLKKRNRSRTHKLKRLYKVGLTARVESLYDEESLGEDASKQGRIEAIDADEDITLVNDQDDADKDMFDVNVLGGEEVFAAAGQNENIVNITTEELTLAQALEALETSKPKVKGLVIQEPEKIRNHFAAKRAEEKMNKPPTQAQKRKIMCTYLKNMEGYKLKDLKLKEFHKIQKMFDKTFKRVKKFKDIRTELMKGKEKRAGKELIQESTKKQKIEDDKKTEKLKKLMEIILDKKEVAIDAIPLAAKPLRIVD
uniref:Putative ribonuclease H-like domain-containing protein n=1 Tax=Tanacetum cinerariifolium TaxID=118510 RepID=A0A6L2K4R6_TANCI|nr:putative ribonuclease H-like domain-containing protein [Tanacetum cinerariifolium]